MKPGECAISGTGSAVHDIVVIGGSAGSLDAMIKLVRNLPADFRGSLFVVSHIGANPSQLPELLTEAGPLRATHAKHLERVVPGRIYVAPPDRHLLLADRRILLSALPREHFTRPAIDPLFRSAARTYGPRVLGIVLSGTGSDGATGLSDIRGAGGIAIVQDPTDAAFPEMPAAALHAVQIDHVVSSVALGSLLTTLLEEPAAPVAASPEAASVAAMDFEEPVAFTCPECGGAIHEEDGAGILTYRCHTGHRFGASELFAHQGSDVERAVMVAVRVLRERIALCGRMLGDAKASGRTHGVTYWNGLKREADSQLDVLEQFLQRPEPKANEAAYATASK
jgi:two-component system chemotaxis response regulator CheB